MIRLHKNLLEGDHVTILNTLSVLGQVDVNQMKVEVNLHVNFLEEKPNVKGVGYRWMFDIDYLTDSMNYISVSLENQAKPHAAVQHTAAKVGTRKPSTNLKKEEFLTELQNHKTQEKARLSKTNLSVQTQSNSEEVIDDAHLLIKNDSICLALTSLKANLSKGFLMRSYDDEGRDP
ncbi:hypothetical protein Tco_0214577 [Tanacetum coccineum]